MTADLSRRLHNRSKSRPKHRRPAVEALESRQLLTTFVVTNGNDAGPGSLRRAIVNVNNDTSATSLITFNMGASGLQKVFLNSALPAITHPVVIDGTTELGYSGTPIVGLDGTNAGATSDGLDIEADGSTVKGLIVVKFGMDGIFVGANRCVIASNYIGTDRTGNPSLGNGRQGILINGANNTIGGSAQGMGNAISGNGNDGLQLAGVETTGNVVQGNTIGQIGGASPAPGNARLGILVNFQASGNLIGTDGDGINDNVERNLITGNASVGVEIAGVGVRNNVVAGNNIGTGPQGRVAFPNGQGGVWIFGGATNNRIGTDGLSAFNANQGNIISANGDNGVTISDAGTNSNVVAGNLIGTQGDGTSALGNAGDGVTIIGGPQFNVIGTNGDGHGDADERNVLADNLYQGVYIGDVGTNSNIVAGNLIGVDITGEAVLANHLNGVMIANGAQSNRIGVTAGHVGALAERNVISGNDQSGVQISDGGTNFNVVAGNFIGNSLADSFTVANGGDGVTISRGAQSNTIGGPAALANNIVNNQQNGVSITGIGSIGNTIRYNSIRKNWMGLGIDLKGDGVTPNHGATASVGPNNLQNYPLITSAGPGTTTTASVSFVGLPSASYTLDFYSGQVDDPSGFGEGESWLGSVSVTTDATGQIIAPTTFNFPVSTSPGRWITATATDQAGNTSEFSNAVQLAIISPRISATPSNNSPVYGGPLRWIVSVAEIVPGFPIPTGTVQFQVDGAAFGSAVTVVNGVATSGDLSTLSAGTHAIVAVYSGDSTYTTSTVTASQVIAPAPLTITAADKSKVYGAEDLALTYTVLGLVNGDSPSVVTGLTLSTTTGPAANVGSHAIVVSGGIATNYAITDVNGTLTVSRAHLTVTADNKTRVRSKANPPLTATITGFVYGESAGVVTGAPTLSTVADLSSPAGSYAITVARGSLSAANYDFNSLVNGTLTVSAPRVTGDFNGDGLTDVGIYQPNTGLFALATLTPGRYTIGPQFFPKLTAHAGSKSVPITGDFNGDGLGDIGLYFPTLDLFELGLLNAQGQVTKEVDIHYGYHVATDAIPVTGDWSGGGITGIGVYVPDKDVFALAVLDSDVKVAQQIVNPYGYHTKGVYSVPVTGDWSGNGTTGVGIYVPADDVFALAVLSPGKYAIAQQVVTPYGYHTKGVYSVPVTGDWSGNGTTGVGIYLPADDIFALGVLSPGKYTIAQQIVNPYGYHTKGVYSVPVTGDWSGNGTTGVGIYLPADDIFALGVLSPGKYTIAQQIVNPYGFHTNNVLATPIPATLGQPAGNSSTTLASAMISGSGPIPAAVSMASSRDPGTASPSTPSPASTPTVSVTPTSVMIRKRVIPQVSGPRWALSTLRRNGAPSIVADLG